MKIAILADSIATQKAGIHYYGLQLVRKLVNRCGDHHLILVTPNHLPEFADLEQVVIPIKNRIPGHLRIRQLTSIPFQLRRREVEVVIELAHFGPFFLPKQMKRVTVIHDLTPLKFPAFHSRLSTLSHQLLLSRIIKNADYVISNSQTTKEDIIRTFKKDDDKVGIIYPTVVEPVGMSVDSPLFLGHPYFLSVGTLEPRKNYPELIRAFEALSKNHGELKTRLIIVGAAGWKNSELYNALEKSVFRDRIILMGSVSRHRLWELYKNALALISTSISEGFGLPLVEAMSMQKAMILSDIPVYREVAQEAALYYEPEETALLVQHMKDIQDEELRTRKASQSESRMKHLASLEDEWPDFLKA